MLTFYCNILFKKENIVFFKSQEKTQIRLFKNVSLSNELYLRNNRFIRRV